MFCNRDIDYYIFNFLTFNTVRKIFTISRYYNEFICTLPCYSILNSTKYTQLIYMSTHTSNILLYKWYANNSKITYLKDIYCASEYGSLRVVKFLYNIYKNCFPKADGSCNFNIYKYATCHKICSASLSASIGGNIETFKFLVENGANQCARNHEALRLALYNDKVCMTIYLLKNCTNTDHYIEKKKVVKKFFKKFKYDTCSESHVNKLHIYQSKNCILHLAHISNK